MEITKIFTEEEIVKFYENNFANIKQTTINIKPELIKIGWFVKENFLYQNQQIEQAVIFTNEELFYVHGKTCLFSNEEIKEKNASYKELINEKLETKSSNQFESKQTERIL